MSFNRRNPLHSLRFLFAFSLFCTSVFSCAAEKMDVRELWIEPSGGTPVALKAEIARTEEERSRGLMNRDRLNDGEGMLFVFERDQMLSFWMKNTRIPLSIAFIASDGTIVEIKDMQPHSLKAVQSSRSVRYALETPQGWFSRVGAVPGDMVKLPQ